MESPIVRQYRELVNKFLAGKATPAELEQLDNYYYSFDDAGKLSERLSEEDLKVMEVRIKSKLDVRIGQEKSATVLIFRKSWFRVAAAVLICSLGAALFFKERQSRNAPLSDAAQMSPESQMNKYLRLKDGSTVILRGKSQLVVSSQFNGAERVVILNGEAYFDIKHDNRRPFIIHTENITTTVLGTAFSIKAYAGQKNIIVTVTRGRVKITRDQQVLGVLTPGRQLVAPGASNNHEINAVLKYVSPAQETSWVRKDMTFDEMPFSLLAKHLGERYGIQITFKNAELGGCPITGTFDGTESLQEVLNTLSTTRGTTYKLTGNQAVIDGPGCK
jgi:transmembrane sensor